MEIDINETCLHRQYPEAFNMLLRDQTRFLHYSQMHNNLGDNELFLHIDDPCNHIMWATDDYEYLGEGYHFHDYITSEKVINENEIIIRPRCKKSIEEQIRRVKGKAEVFTPSWVCNSQNNVVDDLWFGEKGVFNIETILDDGTHSWITTESPISFLKGKTWKDYVRDIRLEITCGEAPYLCSRYDTTTGEEIPIQKRIGLLDRKLRVVSENCNTTTDWLAMAQEAYKSTYAYEWQGDNLLLARESLLCTFIEFYQAKFHKLPINRSVNSIANIISWNVWQMDGLKMVIPDSCNQVFTNTIFGEEKQSCLGCENNDLHHHIGTYCFIKNWRNKKGSQEILFSSLLH